METKAERREFLKRSIYWSIGTWGFLRGNAPRSFATTGASDPDPPRDTRTGARSRVVISRNDGIRRTGGALNGALLERMINSALVALTGAPSDSQAWRQCFDPSDTVGIKVNCLAGKGLSTHPELVEGIIKGLRSAGVPDKRIIIWDRLSQDLERAGFTVNVNGRGVRCYGTDAPGADYERRLTVIGSVGSRLSRILTEQCSAVINVPVLKDHSIAGISVSLKNYFGAIDNPNKYHLDGCDPYVADLCASEAIRAKSRLIICDALTAQYEGGPPYMPHWAWSFNGLLVGKDPVAVDQVAYGIIDGKRKEMGLPSLGEAGRAPTYVATAAGERHRLGTNDLNDIDVVRIS